MEQDKNLQEEISLKDLFLIIGGYYREVVKNWKLLIILALILAGYSLYKTYTRDVTYPARLTFMLNEDNGGSVGNLGSLGSIFGGSVSEYNLEKMNALMKSRTIIQSVLFEKIKYKEELDYYANHIIREYKYHEKWEGPLTNFLFTHDDIDNFSRVENMVLKQILRKVVGNPAQDVKGLLSMEINHETGIMAMMFNSLNEQLSINFSKMLFSKLSKFYIDKTVEKQKETLRLTTQKADSISGVLNLKQNRLLRIMDTQRNLSLYQFKAEEIALQRDIQTLAVAHGEALRNKEIADFSLKTKTPFIQSIDLPISPISPSKNLMTYIRGAIIFAILGVFFGIFYTIIRKMYRDIMTD